MMEGRSLSMASEKSSRARVERRSKRPPPKILVTPRASSSVVTFLSHQVTRGPAIRPCLAGPRLLRPTAIDCLRAARMERTARREVTQERQKAGDAVERSLLLERGQAGDEQPSVGKEHTSELQSLRHLVC